MHLAKLGLIYLYVNQVNCDFCWLEFGENEYVVMSHHGATNYAGAIGLCLSLNASLVSIHSEEENTYIDFIREKFVGVPVWIGMRSFGKGLFYIWTDETPTDYLPEVQRFSEPIDIACVYLYNKWYEGDCGNSLHFVCKRVSTNSTEQCPKITTSPIPTIEPNTSLHTRSPVETTNNNTVLMNITTEVESTENTIAKQNLTTIQDTTIGTQDHVTNLHTTKTNIVFSTEPDMESTSELTTRNIPTSSDSENGHQTTKGTDILLRTSNIPASTTQKPELSPIEIDEKVQEIVKKLKIYHLPKRPAREAPGGEAIGAVALFILLGILGGIVLLDLVTIQNHIKFFLRNIRRRPYKPHRSRKAGKRRVNDQSTQTEFEELFEIF